VTNVAHTSAMSPKQRFPVMLDPEDLAALKRLQLRSGASVGEQIRRAVKAWIQSEVTVEKKAGRPRAVTRKRP
jgi:Ribbon-helix-helix protein, copG family